MSLCSVDIDFSICSASPISNIKSLISASYHQLEARGCGQQRSHSVQVIRFWLHNRNAIRYLIFGGSSPANRVTSYCVHFYLVHTDDNIDVNRLLLWICFARTAINWTLVTLSVFLRAFEWVIIPISTFKLLSQTNDLKIQEEKNTPKSPHVARQSVIERFIVTEIDKIPLRVWSL